MYPYTTRAARFSDRREAGRLLATRLTAYADRNDVVISTALIPGRAAPAGHLHLPDHQPDYKPYCWTCICSRPA